MRTAESNPDSEDALGCLRATMTAMIGLNSPNVSKDDDDVKDATLDAQPAQRYRQEQRSIHRG